MGAAGQIAQSVPDMFGDGRAEILVYDGAIERISVISSESEYSVVRRLPSFLTQQPPELL
jgi:hypothetical protein